MRWRFLVLGIAACTPFASSATHDDAQDAGTSDGSTAIPSEAGPTNDDAGPTNDDAGFCSGVFAFCDDFERDASDVLGGRWFEVVNKDAGDAPPALVYPSTPYVGQALRFSLIKDGPTGSHKYLNTSVVSLNGHRSMTIEVAFLPLDPARHTDLLTLVMASSTTAQATQVVALAYNADSTIGTGAQVFLGSKSGDFQPIATSKSPLTPGTWAVLSVSVTLAAPDGSEPARLTASVNGVEFATAAALDAVGAPIDQFSLSLGPDYAEPGGAGDRWLDNVKVTLED